MSQVGSGEVAIFPTFQNFRSKVVKEVDSVGKESGSRFTSGFKGAAAGIAAVFAGIKVTEKVGQFFKDGVRGAGQLQQSVGAVSAIFKDNAGQMNTWAAQAETAVGLTKNEFNELGSLIGSQLKNGGTAMDQLAPKTNQLIGLGADLSSMFGGTTRTAVEALSSALKGERDPIEKYGVSLTQAKIDAEAAALGFEKVGGALSSEATQAATLSLIMKQTTDAHGNFAKESDTLAGKQQRLAAIWENGKASIMESLLPAITAVTGWLGDKLPGAIVVAQDTMTNLIARASELWAGLTAPPGVEAGAGGLVGFGAKVREVFDGIAAAVGPFFAQIGAAFSTGDFSGITEFFSGFMAVARPAGPIIAEVGASMGAMSSEIGGLVAGAMPLLPPLMRGAADVMKFLADNSGILTAAIVALAAGVLVMKTAQMAANVAAIGAVPTNIALAASNFAQAAATRANTAAQVQGAAAMVATATVERTSLATKLATVGALIAQGAAFVTHKAILVGSAVATGVATAAQWAYNAALSANPIGIVVLAIAALVAGLVWFFTQTKLGQEVWANFTRFLTEAWTNLSAVFSAVWNGIVQVFTAVWNFIVAAATTYVNIVRTVIMAVVGAISGWWSGIWNGISSVFRFIWAAIVAYVTTYINVVRTIITTVVSAISSVWNSTWNGIVNFFRNAWNGILSVLNTLRATFSSVFSSIAGIVSNAFNGVVSTVRGVINSIIGAVNGVIGNINGVAGAIGGAIGINLSVPKIPRLAEGGIISARPGGGIYNIGEGRYDEAVVPLDSKFYDALAGRGSSSEVKVEIINKSGVSTLGDLIEMYIEQDGVRRRVELDNGSRIR